MNNQSCIKSLSKIDNFKGLKNNRIYSKARCALYKKIHDLLDEESVSRARSGRASL